MWINISISPRLRFLEAAILLVLRSESVFELFQVWLLQHHAASTSGEEQLFCAGRIEIHYKHSFFI